MADWDDDQLSNAETIIQVGVDLGASHRDIRIALMTAMQESTLHNYSGGDLNSVGLFQQRDAWGTFEQRHDPAQAAEMFFTGGHAGQRGLFDFADRDSMRLTEAAQSVQVSAYPDLYAQWHDEAADLLRTSPLLTGADLPDAGGPGTDGSPVVVPSGGGSAVDDGFGDDPFAADAAPPVSAKDSDDDGLTDEFEKLLGTDIHARDSDHDGRTDLQETVLDHTDPLSAGGHGDGKAGEEWSVPAAALKAGFVGGQTLDSDHDGLSDTTEAKLGSDWQQADSDHDGVSDSVEYRLGSDLADIDSDHDGITDGQELQAGTLADLDPSGSADVAGH